jgi:hypothetical protein
MGQNIPAAIKLNTIAFFAVSLVVKVIFALSVKLFLIVALP